MLEVCGYRGRYVLLLLAACTLLKTIMVMEHLVDVVPGKSRSSSLVYISAVFTRNYPGFSRFGQNNRGNQSTLSWRRELGRSLHRISGWVHEAPCLEHGSPRSATRYPRSSTVRQFSSDPIAPRQPSWKDHPVLKAGSSVRPPILVRYTTFTSAAGLEFQQTSRGLYTQGGCKLTLVRDDHVKAGRRSYLHGFDILVVQNTASSRAKMVEFETTRESQICLAMSVDQNGAFRGPQRKMRVPSGYRNLGLSVWDKGSPKPSGGKRSSFKGKPLNSPYIACKRIRPGVHHLPSPDLLDTEYPVQKFNILFSEADGTAPKPPAPPAGWKQGPILQHSLCPDALHEMWSVSANDVIDIDTRGKRFKTWHPQKDYIYGCYYGHEHGVPGILAGYREKYDYTAWKNYRQSESHEGFKSYVLPVGEYFVYLSIHANTKHLSRVNTRHHSVTLVVNEKISGKNMFEMSCKADFGASFVMLRKPLPWTFGTTKYPIGSRENRDLLHQLFYNKSNAKKPKPSRRINVVNDRNLNPIFKYKTSKNGKRLRRGQYEMWTGGIDRGAFCMRARKSEEGIRLDIKNPETGCTYTDCTEAATLGTQTSTGFYPSLGTSRDLTFRDVEVHPDYCGIKLPPADSAGYIKFYTDPYCLSLCSGPGPTCLLQKIHTSFRGIKLNNRYSVNDVHGLNTYLPVFQEPWNGKANQDGRDGLTGVQQIESALSL